MTQNQKHDTAYVQDSTFQSGYIADQRPAVLSYVAASAGFVPPHPGSEFTYLELGCSSGVTLNGLAAANPQAHFVGIDFIEEHVVQARNAATAAHLENVQYHQADFRDFEQLNLPQVDFIAIHGAYSWLDPAAEDAVHAIVDKHLKEGGLFYVDYMVMPGKAPIAPIWQLMRNLTDSGYENSTQRASDGFEFLRSLVKADAKFFAQNPHAKQIFDVWDQALKAGPGGARHLAHASLTDHWLPKYSCDVAATLQAFGLQFAGSTIFELNDLELSLPRALRSEDHARLSVSQREMIKDFFHYTQQRQDVFVRSKSPAAPDDALLSSKTYMAFLWPGANPQWTFQDPEKRTLDTDLKMIGVVCDLIARGTVCVDDIAAHLKSDGHTSAAIAKTLKRMFTVNDLDLFAAPPGQVDRTSIAGTRAANGYNEIAVQNLIKNGGELLLACQSTGGCVSLPALVSTVVAAFVGHNVADVTVEKTVAFARAVPGSYMTGQGQSMRGSQITPQMIGPAHDLVKKVVLPRLIELGALAAD